MQRNIESACTRHYFARARARVRTRARMRSTQVAGYAFMLQVRSGHVVHVLYRLRDRTDHLADGFE